MPVTALLLTTNHGELDILNFAFAYVDKDVSALPHAASPTLIISKHDPVFISSTFCRWPVMPRWTIHGKYSMKSPMSSFGTQSCRCGCRLAAGTFLTTEVSTLFSLPLLLDPVLLSSC
jgi:hypothetical protein